MNQNHEKPNRRRANLSHLEIPWDTEVWQRWDEDLVEDFDRWLTRIVRGLIVVLIAGSVLAIVALF